MNKLLILLLTSKMLVSCSPNIKIGDCFEDVNGLQSKVVYIKNDLIKLEMITNGFEYKQLWYNKRSFDSSDSQLFISTGCPQKNINAQKKDCEQKGFFFDPCLCRPDLKGCPPNE